MENDSAVEALGEYMFTASTFAFFRDADVRASPKNLHEAFAIAEENVAAALKSL